MAKETLQSGTLEQELTKQQAAAEAESEKMMARRMDWIQTTAAGDEGGIKGQFNAVYRVKAEELTRELLKLSQLSESGELSKEVILGLQETLLGSLQRRAGMSVEVMDTKAAKTDIQAQVSRGIAFLHAANLPSLLYQHLEKKMPEVAVFYLKNLESRGLKVEPDFDETTQNIYKDTLTEIDWEVITKNAQVLVSGGKDFVEEGVAVSIMAIMKPKQRTEFVERMLTQPNYQHILNTLLISGYLKTVQVTTTLEAAIKTSNDSAKTQELQSYLLAVQDPEMAKAQEQTETAKIKYMKKRKRGRHFGSSNNARQLLTFKGLGGTLLALNGMATVAANVMMNIHQPSQLLNNKSLGIGLVMTVGGLELSNGMGGMMDKPSTNLAQALDVNGRKARREQEQAIYAEAFESEILRHDKAGNLYFQFAEQINKAYNDKRAQTHNSKVALTMEEVGLDWQKLERDFSPLSKKEAEEVFSEWVSRMGKQGSTNYMSVETQKEFIGRGAREKYGLAPIEPLKPEILQSYLLPKPTETTK